jgi:hypothetical protein
MAKHCDVCDQDYADNLTACPHCAAGKKTQLAGRGEERKTQLAAQSDERTTQLAGPGKEPAGPPQPEATPADSAVNLGGAPVEVAAGDSGVLLEEVASNSGVNLAEAAVVDVAKPEPPEPSASDIALESLMAEPPTGEVIAQEKAVSEKEVDEMLAHLEETPAEESTASSVSATQETAPSAEGEEAITAAEAEEAVEAAEAAEAEEEKPAKATKPRSNILALAGATILGILIGAGGTIGVRALMGPGEEKKASLPLNVPQGLPQAAKAAPSLETLAARVASGDWDEAKTAGIEQVQAASAKEWTVRGEYHLGSYLKNVGSKINPQDPALAPALDDLKKAAEQNDPNALYDLAFIKELAGQLPEARAEYAKAAQMFANDPVQKQRFEAAVKRVDLKTAAKAAGAALMPPQGGGKDCTVLLALLLIGLQQPQSQPQPQQQPPQQQPQSQPQPSPPAPPPQQADNKEAGFAFWEAAHLAHRGQFEEAIRALDQARKLHDQRRFTRLRKAQNPLSDPAEEIFLRCCDELKAYWQLEKELRDGGYLTDKTTPSQALQALVQKVQQSTKMAKELQDKITAAQKDQKEAEAKAADLEKALQNAKQENTKLDGELKAAKKTIEERQADLTSAKEQIGKLTKDKDDLNATLTKVRTKLAEAKFFDSDGKANIDEAVKKAIEVAKSKDPQGVIRRQRDEIERLSASLQERRRPEEMLPLWLLLLDENRNRSELVGQAVRDANRVLADPQASAVQKGEAEVVLGLALRNSEQFSEAKKRLEAAKGAVDKGEWQVRAEAALKEVSHPAAYFISQARNLYDQGRMEAALDVLTRAMKVLPEKEQGKLLAQRGLIELDAAQAKAKGVLPPTEPLLMAARKDADAAIRAGAAEGHYVAGRIAEELGQVDAAIASYRAALAAHGDRLDAEGGRYRMALARVLLLPREARPRSPAGPAGAAQKVGFADTKNLVLMLTLGLQAPLLPAEGPGQEEAEKLADEVLKAPPGTVPFLVLAQALAIKGRWNQALQTYVEGIRPMLPREYGNGLVYLLQNDPRLKRPDSLRAPNPLEAETHFAAGMNFYFDRDYVQAEKEFLLTIENDSQDARFFYFLGLARLAQGRRRDAYVDFGQGALLERQNRPSPAAVNEALERIQGPMRFLVNKFREGPER